MRRSGAPLREREFRLLFAGRTISLAGSAIAPVALAFAVLDLTGSKTDLGLILAAREVPLILFLLVGAIWADRLPRNKVMVSANVVSALSQASAAALLITGNAEIWQLAGLAAINGSASAFFFPASAGVTPQTVPGPMLQTRMRCFHWRSASPRSAAPRSAGSSSQRSTRAGRSRSTPAPTCSAPG